MAFSLITPPPGGATVGPLIARTRVTAAMIAAGTDLPGTGGDILSNLSVGVDDLITIESISSITANTVDGVRECHHYQIDLTDVLPAWDPSIHDIGVWLIDLAYTKDSLIAAIGICDSEPSSGTHGIGVAAVPADGRAGYMGFINDVTFAVASTPLEGVYGRIRYPYGDDRLQGTFYGIGPNEVLEPLSEEFPDSGFDPDAGRLFIGLGARSNVSQVSTISFRAYVDLIPKLDWVA